MTLKELKTILNSIDPNCDHLEVEIPLAETTIGPTNSSPVKLVAEGFDWNKGKLFLVPKINSKRQVKLERKLLCGN